MSRRSKSGFEAKVYKFDATCEGKRFFATEKEAFDAAEFGMLENMTVTLGIYHCMNCQNWHLTSMRDPYET